MRFKCFSRFSGSFWSEFAAMGSLVSSPAPEFLLNILKIFSWIPGSLIISARTSLPSVWRFLFKLAFCEEIWPKFRGEIGSLLSLFRRLLDLFDLLDLLLRPLFYRSSNLSIRLPSSSSLALFTVDRCRIELVSSLLRSSTRPVLKC